MTARQPFDAAIAYLLDKLAIPTDTWDVLWEEINDQAFGIAGFSLSFHFFPAAVLY